MRVRTASAPPERRWHPSSTRGVVHEFEACSAGVGSTAEGVRQLEEALALHRRPLVVGVQLAGVRVAEIEHRLPVELVGEDRRAAEIAAMRLDRGRRQARIALYIAPLADDPEPGAGAEGVYAAQAWDLRRQETVRVAASRVHIEPAAPVRSGEPQTVGRTQIQARRQVAALRVAVVGEVHL